MRVQSILRVAILVATGFLLSACAPRETRPEGSWLADRTALFEAYSAWSVSGRVGLSDGERGGSLSFTWEADGDEHRVFLRTMTGGKQWRLVFDRAHAVLEGSDVGVIKGPGPDGLVEQAVGWPIPVAELVYWIRGLLPPHNAVDTEFAQDGTLAGAFSPPWVLEFQRYVNAQDVLLPARLEATSSSYRVRIVLRQWQLGVQP